MKVTMVTTIHLDGDEEIPYTLDGVDYRVSAVASVGVNRPLIYARRVYPNGRATKVTLRYHDLPVAAAAQVADLVRATVAGVTS